MLVTEEQKQKHREYQRKWREKNKERIRAKDRAHYANNKGHIKERIRKWQDTHPDRVRAYYNRFAENNKDKIKEYKREYYKKNRAKIIARAKAWQKDNPDRRTAINKRYFQKNSERIYQQQRARRAAAAAKQEATEEIERIRDKIRARDSLLFKPIQKKLKVPTHIHHNWVPNSPQYLGVALIDANKYKNGEIVIVEMLVGEM